MRCSENLGGIPSVTNKNQTLAMVWLYITLLCSFTNVAWRQTSTFSARSASSQKQKALQYSLHILLYCIRSEHNMQSFRREFPVAFGRKCIAAQLRYMQAAQQNHRPDISSRERRTQSVFELLADRISYIIRQHLFHINITRFRNAIR